MEQSEAPPVLGPEVVAFVHGGVLAGVATRDDALKPTLVRAWGPEVSADGRSLSLCVAAPPGSRTRANLESNGAVAVGFCPPTIARAVQVKGVATVVAEPEPDDLERAERHFGLFAAEAARVGTPPGLPERLFVRSGLILIRFTIEQVFDQTPGPDSRPPCMTEFSVPLESIAPCFQGVIPSWLTTCSADGVPNATIISIVRYVDSDSVALTRQFFNKTRANLDANPQAQVLVVNPVTGEQFALDLRYLRTESEGPTFDAVEANLAAVASQMGMSDVFRLRGVDIHRVLACEPFGETAVPPPPEAVRERSVDPNALVLLDEFVRRLAASVEYAEAARVGLEALDDLFGYGFAVLLTADERGDRLFAVASNGYVSSGVGAEVPIGVGVVGVAAERRRVVCVPSLVRSRAMSAAIQDSVRRGGAEPSAVEIELPGLERVQSAAAVPLLARGELTGVLYLESEQQGTFGPGEERLLRIIGGQLAAALAVLQADRSESTAHEPAPAEPAGGAPLAVAYYQADDSVFVDDSYVVKGVPGRILWKLLREHDADGRTSFTNRELRLDERLGLPPGNDNLEARLLVLRKRLAGLDCGIRLDRVDRGLLSLQVAAPLELAEIATTGPMRAAHDPKSDG